MTCSDSLPAAVVLGRGAAQGTIALTLDTLSEISEIGLLDVDGEAVVQGRIHSTTWIALNTQRLTVGILGSLAAALIDITSNEVVLNGKLQAAQVVDQGGAKHACPPKTLSCNNMPSYPDPCRYPLQLKTQQLTIQKGGIIAASEVSLCTSMFYCYGMVTTNALGFPANTGPQHGCVSTKADSTFQAAASGGAHGGAGGASSMFQNTSGCPGKLPYDDPFAPGRLGSGGGGANGGSGGGIVHVEATSQLRVYNGGTIDASGDAASADTGSFHSGGSGGGAGGSIWLRSPVVEIDPGGKVAADGGAGGDPGGGGGGSGLVHLETVAWAPQDMWELKPSPFELLESVSCKGGDGGGSKGIDHQLPGSPGGSTLPSGPNCTVGRGGPLCQPCPAGGYKDTIGPQHCSSCAPGTASKSGSSSCAACQPGTYSTYSGSANCEQCAPGTISTSAGATSCASCAAGTHAPDAGSVNCSSCPTGMVAVEGTGNCSFCELGEVARADLVQCDPCGMGARCRRSSRTRVICHYMRRRRVTCSSRTCRATPLPLPTAHLLAARHVTHVTSAACNAGNACSIGRSSFSPLLHPSSPAERALSVGTHLLTNRALPCTHTSRRPRACVRRRHDGGAAQRQVHRAS